MIIGIDHGYYAMKTKQVCFPTGLMRYTYEPYTMQNVLQYGGVYYVCGTGRQTLVKDKTANDNYYLLTLAALAQEIRKRKGERTAKVVLAAGLPLAGFGREKQKFKEYLFRKEQPVRFFYEGERYEIQIEDVKLFPQGYSALALYPEYLKDEPSVLLVDIGGWTVDLMRLDNAVPNAATNQREHCKKSGGADCSGDEGSEKDQGKDQPASDVKGTAGNEVFHHSP